MISPRRLDLVVRNHALVEATSLKVTSGAKALITQCNGAPADTVRGSDLRMEEPQWGTGPISFALRPSMKPAVILRMLDADVVRLAPLSWPAAPHWNRLSDVLIRS